MNVTRYLEKSMSRRFVTRTSPWAAQIGELDWSAGEFATKPEELTTISRAKPKTNFVPMILNNV
jgi:hypothetical protein